MRNVVFENKESINVSDFSSSDPIFAKKDGVWCGMVVKEYGKGWIVKIDGGDFGTCGHHETREMAIISASQFGYTFHTP